MPTMVPRFFVKLLLRGTMAASFVIITSCSSEPNSDIRVALSPSQSLSETDAGWWLRELGISKQAQDEDPALRVHNALVYRVRHALETQGRLHDQYIEGKDTLVKEYIISVKRQLYGPRELLIREKQTGGENASLWFEIPLPPEGIPWLNLLSGHLARGQISDAQSEQFIATKSRGDKNVVTIESPGEQGERLFLYGPGAYCTQVSLD
jgi:hypothetical protein